MKRESSFFEHIKRSRTSELPHKPKGSSSCLRASISIMETLIRSPQVLETQAVEQSKNLKKLQRGSDAPMIELKDSARDASSIRDQIKARNMWVALDSKS